MDKDIKKVIDASPTKEFFVEMLVRDIPLSRAILDLVDNSVDSARSLAINEDLSPYHIDITLDDKKFIIEDNCAGIDIKTARDYAFRFGRVKDERNTKNSIGQFGVGMKRALFKIGETFKITSKSSNNYLHVEQNINDWLVSKDEEGKEAWSFIFEEDTNDNISNNETGTRIEINSLHPSIENDFNDKFFIQQLVKEIELAHSVSITKGLRVNLYSDYHDKLKNNPLKAFNIGLINTDLVKPAYKKLLFEKDSENPITVEIFAGVVPRDLDSSGWYIFCNDRTILQSDKSSNTAWGTDKNIKFHHYFSRFKGFVFFSCADSSKLPWTTTKTGIDIDSEVYKLALNEMVNISKPIMSFLKEVGKETIDFNEGKINSKPLTDYITEEKIQSYKAISIDNKVNSILKVTIERAQISNNYSYEKQIQYKRSEEKITKLIEIIETANTAKDVGEFTFDYYYNLFIGDDEE